MAGESSRSLKQTVDFQSASSPLPAPSSAKARRVPKLPSSELEVSESVDGEEEDAEEWEKRAFPVLGPTSDGLFDRSHAQRYKLRTSWESLVEKVDSADDDTVEGLLFLVIWKEDGSFSWVPFAEVRIQCPQKLIDFFEAKTKFTHSSPD